MKLNADFKEKFNLESPITAMWEFIKTSLLTILEQTVPSKMSSSRFNQPWINQKIKKLTRQKKRSFEKARKTKRKSDFDRYHRLKAATQKECRKAYRDYINDIINPELSANPKRFWGFIKSKKCESVGVSPLKDTDGLTYSESEKKANILNDQFSSVFNTSEDIKTIPNKGKSPHPTMNRIHVTENGVQKLLSNLNIHKAAGPDEIPTRLLKELAPYLAETFTTFFQASINQGTIPPEWKEAFVRTALYWKKKKKKKEEEEEEKED
ncbi:Hypothetical predicted protein [Mytilus galloprovincialis]|uniref:Reverse transcriptase domain-containing protein n=1 Tax=Mytilus galloprovincialis TaxID=29158 RepID=A0A8B6F443_MYTGA|nr:Hypothetical predicted protein [Mytilus galloprovincialis]